MVAYPFSLAFQALQPLVLLEGQIHAKTRRDAPVALITPAGAVHSLAPVASLAGMAREFRTQQKAAVGLLLEQELARRQSAGATFSLAYFIEVLVPQFQARDHDGEVSPEAALPAAGAEPPHDLAELAGAAPLPDPPAPSLWLCGRAWQLAPMPARPGCLYLRRPGSVLGVTGDFHYVGALESEWRRTLHRWAVETVARVAEKAGPQVGRETADLLRAREEIARTGAAQAGDMIYIASPPRIGCILPHCKEWAGPLPARDLAVTAPATLTPALPAMSLYARSPQGVWQPFSPRHGLCLGTGPLGPPPPAPTIALPAHLRWAAQRIVSNRGRFHGSD